MRFNYYVPRLITCSKKALSKLIKESRPCAAGCGNARHNRRRSATPNAIAWEVAPWPAVTQKQRAAMQAHQGKHSHSKQQSKRYKASGPATATCAPVPPQAYPRALCRPECHVIHLALPFEGERRIPGVLTGRGSPTNGHAPPLSAPLASAPPWVAGPSSVSRLLKV